MTGDRAVEDIRTRQSGEAHSPFTPERYAKINFQLVDRERVQEQILIADVHGNLPGRCGELLLGEGGVVSPKDEVIRLRLLPVALHGKSDAHQGEEEADRDQSKRSWGQHGQQGAETR